MLTTDRINHLLKSKFTFLLGSIILYMLIFPVTESILPLRFLMLMLTILIYFGIILAIPHNKLYRIYFFMLTVFSVIFNFFFLMTHNEVFKIIFSCLFILFYASSIYSFTKDIMRKKIITHDVIMGAICIYFLIGIVFAYIYGLVQLFHPHSFTVIRTAHAPSGFELLYFSFTTLTTLGYGDIVSTSIFSKPYVILESVAGVFYLAVLVARLVSSFSKQQD